MDTAAGDPIDNEQLEEISYQELTQYQLIRRKYPRADERSRPNPQYNCHGMTFGSRRTGVFEDEEITKILSHDEYLEIPATDVKHGDVILYFGQSGDVQHSGFVVSGPMGLVLSVPYVVSKWGKGGQYVHIANDCPYPYSNVKFYRISK